MAATFTESELAQIRAQIIASAGRPKSITVDGETFTAHGLNELLEAYRVMTSASSRPNSGIKFSKIVPPGASGTRSE